MLEKCCHDIDFYSMITNSRPIKLLVLVHVDLLFQKIYQNGSVEEYTKDRLKVGNQKIMFLIVMLILLIIKLQ